MLTGAREVGIVDYNVSVRNGVATAAMDEREYMAYASRVAVAAG
jgi:hypothetical protein